MNKISLFAALAAAPFLVGTTVFAQSAETPAARAPAVSMESVGVVSAKVVPAVLAKVKQNGRSIELDAFTQALENRLTEALTSTRKFKVVTRGDLDEVLKEQNLASSGNLDADDPQLAKRFKLAGVKSILLVTVDDFQYRVEEYRSEALDQTLRRVIVRASAAAKLIDTTTGAVKDAVAIAPVTQDDIRGLLAKLTTTQERADAIAPELARLVSTRVAQRLVDARFPAKVMAKSPDAVITFNRGDGSGVSVGQEWNVYAVGEAMVDPDTGESLGAEEVLIGRAVVTDVEPKFAKAKILKDSGIERGAVMRPAKDLPPPAPVEVKKVEAPAPPAAPAAAPKADAVKLSLKQQDGKNVLSLDGNTIAPGDAKDTFAKLALAHPGAKVVVEADKAVPGESVDRVVAALGEAGFKNVSTSTSN